MSTTLGYTTTPTFGTFTQTSSAQMAVGYYVTAPGGTIAVFQIVCHFRASDNSAQTAYLCVWTGGGTLLLSHAISISGGEQDWSVTFGGSALSGYADFVIGAAIGSIGYTIACDPNGTGGSKKSATGTAPPSNAAWGASGFGNVKAYMVYNTAPTISGFSPGVGGPGTSVVITGTEFTTATAVKFNGTSAPFTVNSDTQITATVPSGATTGPITVTNPVATATSSSNYVVATGWVLRSGVWTQGNVLVDRSAVQTNAQELAVLRSSVWTPGA